MSDLRSSDFGGLFKALGGSNFHSRASSIGPSPSNTYKRIQHIDELSSNFGSLLLSHDLSDVVFRIGDEEFCAHRVILAARSEYFRAMLFGGMREEREQVIVLHETPVFAFKELLKYIYTGCVALSGMKEENVLDLLGLAHKCAFLTLQESIASYLKATLNTRNVCTILTVSQLYCLKSLTSTCLNFSDANAPSILASPLFLSLPSSIIGDLISRDSFCAPEVDIFRAVQKWRDCHPGECVDSLVSRIRLSLISLDDLLHVVRPSGIIPSDSILDAIYLKEQAEKSTTTLIHRGVLLEDVNVAITDYAEVIKGESLFALLLPHESSAIQDGDRVFTRHDIGDEEGIVLAFKNPFIINKIVLTLWDKEPRMMYSYFVEVSMDKKHWLRIVDHTRYLCRSRQNLCFSPRAVKFVRVVGTYNSVSRVFHLVHFEAMYNTEPFVIDPISSLIVPSKNVASMERNATVIEGVCRCKNALLNGETHGYDWDNGYTCHQLGSGSIIVQLPQPFMVASMRLLLWDCDDRYYSYYIEVSVNQHEWKRIVDKTSQECRSWQYLEFSPIPLVFIRIVGTHNSANEVFHCVHLECPASAPLPSVEAIEDEEGEGEGESEGEGEGEGGRQAEPSIHSVE